MQNESLGARLRGQETLYGGWVTIGDVIAVGAMAAAGLDYVVIDLQHGGATERDLPALTTAIARAGAAPVARVRHAHPADIGRALDLGCAGVIVPNVESADQARAVAGACRYPPAGYRSGGGVLAGQDEPFCVIMVESAAAMADLERDARRARSRRDLRRAAGPVVLAGLRARPGRPGPAARAGADLVGVPGGRQAGRRALGRRRDRPAVPGERLPPGQRGFRRAGHCQDHRAPSSPQRVSNHCGACRSPP